MLEPDSIGAGTGEGALHATDTAMEAVRSVASQGYVRGNFLVIRGAKDQGNAAVAVAPTPTPLPGVGVGGSTVGAQQVSVATQTAGLSVSSDIIASTEQRLGQARKAKMRGYEGDPCGECGNFTLVRNGTCMKCNTCGATSGCS